jgi:hypothetical protein
VSYFREGCGRFGADEAYSNQVAVQGHGNFISILEIQFI